MFILKGSCRTFPYAASFIHCQSVFSSILVYICLKLNPCLQFLFQFCQAFLWRSVATAPLTHIFLVTISVIDINWPIVATRLQYKHTIWSLGATKDCSIMRLWVISTRDVFFLPYVGVWDWSTDAKIFASKLCNKWFWHAFM